MRIMASVLVLSVLTIPALAADPPRPGGPVFEACKADIASLCAGIQPGGGRIKECLRANRDKLSEGCKSAIAAMIKARREAKASSAPAQQVAPSTGP